MKPVLMVHWREDRGQYRFWRSDWGPDEFQVVDYSALKTVAVACELLGIPFREAED